MALLSINVNKIALIRNSRQGNNPNLLEFVDNLLKYGVQGITVHPRPDARHITQQDVTDLTLHLPQTIELNIEGNPLQNTFDKKQKSLLDILVTTKPTQFTIVPDSPNQKTSDRGCNLIADRDSFVNIIKLMRANNIRTSFFIEAGINAVKQAAAIGCDAVEFYTGPYAAGITPITTYQQCAELAKTLNLRVNSGHDLNLSNLQQYIRQVQPDEVSIGHGFVIDCLTYGVESTVGQYLELVSN